MPVVYRGIDINYINPIKLIAITWKQRGKDYSKVHGESQEEGSNSVYNINQLTKWSMNVWIKKQYSFLN